MSESNNKRKSHRRSNTSRRRNTNRTVLGMDARTSNIVIRILSGCVIVLLMLLAFLLCYRGKEITKMDYPDAVMNWQEIVEERCRVNNDPSSGINLNKFVPAIMATVYQESSGLSETSGGDIMQSVECGYWSQNLPDDWDSLTQEEKSVDAGVRYFYTGLKKLHVRSPLSYKKLQMVAQGYNFGYGYLDYMIENKNDEWTLETSTAFANSMGPNYGTPIYGEQWIGKYKDAITVEEVTVKQLFKEAKSKRK